jgi:hypothetical protein
MSDKDWTVDMSIETRDVSGAGGGKEEEVGMEEEGGAGAEARPDGDEEREPFIAERGAAAGTETTGGVGVEAGNGGKERGEVEDKSKQTFLGRVEARGTTKRA